jgi:hypothetical protein
MKWSIGGEGGDFDNTTTCDWICWNGWGRLSFIDFPLRENEGKWNLIMSNLDPGVSMYTRYGHVPLSLSEEIWMIWDFKVDWNSF